jgi:hypothetical protein
MIGIDDFLTNLKQGHTLTDGYLARCWLPNSRIQNDDVKPK